jgi:hypothetical protein
LASIYAVVDGTVKDTSVSEILPTFAKYLPDFINRINLPSFNTGIITKTGNTDNAVIVGLYNQIEKTDGDYIAFGLVNKIKEKDGKYSTRLFADASITIDGIFRHKESKLESSIQK